MGKKRFLLQTDFGGNELLNAVLQNLFQFPVNPYEGQVLYRSDLKYGCIYNGTEWMVFGVPPVAKVYDSQDLMILSQEEQLAGFLYFDGLQMYFYKGTTEGTIDDYFAFNEIQEQFIYRLEYGGIVQYAGTGLDFNISPTGAFFGAPVLVEYAGAGRTLTPLNSGTPNNKRIDVIAFTPDGFLVIEGTPSLEPQKPSLNPLTQYELTFVLIEEGQSTPSEINGITVYKENAEWTVTSQGTITVNPASTAQAFEGALSVEVSAVQNGGKVIFTEGADVDLTDSDNVGFWIYPKQMFRNAYRLALQFYNAGGTLVGSSLNYADVANLPINEWSFVALPLSNFIFSTRVVRSLRIEFVRLLGSPTHDGFFLDNVIIQGGITVPPTGDGIGEAPDDGLWYARRNRNWQAFLPFPEAPADGKTYGRKDAGWVLLPDDYIPSTGDIMFDLPRKYGYNGTPVSSNLVINVTDAKEINMAKVLHSGTEPSVTVSGGGVTLHLSGGEYDPAKINEYLFICHKNNDGNVTRISYSISPNQL